MKSNSKSLIEGNMIQISILVTGNKFLYTNNHIVRWYIRFWWIGAYRAPMYLVFPPAPSLILLYHTHQSYKIHEGVLFEEIQDSHFPRKTGVFWYSPPWILRKGGYFLCPVFYHENGVHLGWKVIVLPQKRGFILDWKDSVLLRKRDRFELKSQCFAAKKGVIFKLENKDGYLFSSEWGSQGVATFLSEGMDAVIQDSEEWAQWYLLFDAMTLWKQYQQSDAIYNNQFDAMFQFK